MQIRTERSVCTRPCLWHASLKVAFFLLVTCLFGSTPTVKAQQQSQYQVTGKVTGIKNLKKTEALVIAYQVIKDEAEKVVGLELIGPQYQTSLDAKGEFSLNLQSDTEYQLRCIATGYEPVPYPMKKKTISAGQAIAITLEMKPSDSYLLKATFIHNITGKPITGVKANLTSLQEGTSYAAFSNERGVCFFAVKEGALYTIQGYKKRFFFNDADTFQVKNQRDQLMERKVKLEEIRKGQIVRVKGHFDINSHAITRDGAQELEKLFELLWENPDVQFELSNHCDSRGDDHYNLLLSQKRAESAVNYLISKGIAPTQLVPKGYGESQLLNACKNGVRCPAQKHEENRRMELKVMGFLE